MTIYVVTAYRWGQRDNHSYVVGAATDRKKANAIAQHEFDDRGGKYGMEICEVDTDAPSDYSRECAEQIHFIESSYFGEAGAGKTPANKMGAVEELVARYNRLEKGAKQQ